MKIAVSFFSVLVVIVSGILFVQYQVFSDQIDSSEKTYNYSQEIEIVYRDESLDVRHHFKNLPNKEIAIHWPKDAVSPSCFIETEYSCKRLNEDVTGFNAGETQAQSVSYIIPLKGGLTSSELMKNVFVTLEDGDVKFSTVHISTDSDVTGQWVTGLPLIGLQQLSLVNYTMFSGEGQVKDLFWQSGNFALQKQTGVMSLYSKTPLKSAFYEKLATVNFLNEEHFAVINGTNTASLQGYRMLFIPNITVAKLQQNVIISQLDAMYQFGDSAQWIKELVASYLTGTTIGGEKTKAVLAKLTEQMTDGQLKLWTARLQELEGEKITPAILDVELSAIFDATTRYLTMNDSSDGIYPFLFNDPRDIYVNINEEKNIQIVLKDDQVLYAAIPVLNALGYEAKQGENGFYVNSETRVFRFPEEPGFYVFNQRRYNTISEPIKQIAGEYFIEESWLQRLFLVEIAKSDKRITITTEE